MEREEQAHRFAEAIYGTVVLAGVLVATSAENPDAGDSLAYALATVVVFWLAHAWAHSLGRRAARMGDAGLLASLGRDWPMVASALPVLGALGIALLVGASDETALEIAVWICVVLLAAWGAGVAWREGQSSAGILLAAGGSALLGVALVVLKALVH